MMTVVVMVVVMVMVECYCFADRNLWITIVSRHQSYGTVCALATSASQGSHCS